MSEKRYFFHFGSHPATAAARLCVRLCFHPLFFAMAISSSSSSKEKVIFVWSVIFLLRPPKPNDDDDDHDHVEDHVEGCVAVIQM